MYASITSDMFNYSTMPGMKEKLSLFLDYGFEYLHWCDDWANDKMYSRSEMNAYRKLLDNIGLTCLDVHGTATRRYSIDTQDPDDHKIYIKLLENRIEFTAVVGGDAVVVHPPDYEKSETQKRLLRSMEAIEAVRNLCREHGVVLAIENFNRGDDVALERYFEAYPVEFVGFCYDSGHSNLNMNFETLKKFRDRLMVTHLHDNKGDMDAHQFPGYGTIDWNEVLNWIGDFYKPLNYEVTHYPDLFEGSMEDFLVATVGSINEIKKN